MIALYGRKLRFGKRAAGVVRAAGWKGWWEPHVQDRARLRGRPRQAAAAQPFQEGSVRQPARTAPESLPALLVDALNEKVVATIDGERREISKREAVVTQLVNKSTGAGIAGGGGKAGAEISGPTRTLSYCSPAPAGADGKWRCDPLSHRG